MVDDTTGSQDLFRLIVENNSLGLLVTDLDGNIVYANPRQCETSGYTLEELVGQNPRIFHSGGTPQTTYREMWETIIAGQHLAWRHAQPAQERRLIREYIRISPIREDDGRITHFLAIKEETLAHLRRPGPGRQARRRRRADGTAQPGRAARPARRNHPAQRRRQGRLCPAVPGHRPVPRLQREPSARFRRTRSCSKSSPACRAPCAATTFSPASAATSSCSSFGASPTRSVATKWPSASSARSPNRYSWTMALRN